jgi:hypothetical protein
MATDSGTSVILSLALLLFWTPPALTCRGTPETSTLAYSVGYRWGFMHFGPECPLTEDGKAQTCATWNTLAVQTAQPQASIPDPGPDEVIAYNLDWIAAVDPAGNRSTDPCN